MDPQQSEYPTDSDPLYPKATVMLGTGNILRGNPGVYDPSPMPIDPDSPNWVAPDPETPRVELSLEELEVD